MPVINLVDAQKKNADKLDFSLTFGTPYKLITSINPIAYKDCPFYTLFIVPFEGDYSLCLKVPECSCLDVTDSFKSVIYNPDTLVYPVKLYKCLNGDTVIVEDKIVLEKKFYSFD